MSDFAISYPGQSASVQASLIRVWDECPDETEAPTFRNMVAMLFHIRGVNRVGMFWTGSKLFFLVRGPHCWFDVSAHPVNVKNLSSAD